MAFDFTNRDPKDPKAVATITPYASDAYLPSGANDWSDFTTDPSQATARGLTRKVNVSLVTLNNGDQYYAVQDAQGKPIDIIGERASHDDKQAQAFSQAQTQAQRQTDQSERRRINVEYQGSGKDRQRITHYETGSDLVEAAPESAPARTPDQTRTDAASASKAEAEAQNEQALNDERSWNEQHGYGRVTHAERATQARQDEAQARADNNQARLVAAQEAQNQLAHDRLQFERDQAAKPQNKTEDVVVNGQHYTRVTSVTPAGKATTQVLGPDGKPVSSLPTDEKNTPLPKGAPRYRPDFADPHGDLGLSAYDQSLRDTVESGQLTRSQAADLMEQAGQVATVADRRQTSQQGQGLTQRAQDLGEVQSRRNSADSEFNNVGGMIDKLAANLIPSDGASGQTIVDAYRAMLGDARRNAEAAGGYSTVPPVVGAGAPAVPGIDSTQVVMHPGGAMSISPPGSPPPPLTPPPPVSDPRDAGGVPPSVNDGQSTVPLGADGHVPIRNKQTGETYQVTPAQWAGMTNQDLFEAPPGLAAPAAAPPADSGAPVGLFNPDEHTGMLTSMGLTPDEAANVISLYKRGVRSDHL